MISLLLTLLILLVVLIIISTDVLFQVYTIKILADKENIGMISRLLMAVVTCCLWRSGETVFYFKIFVIAFEYQVVDV